MPLELSPRPLTRKAILALEKEEEIRPEATDER